jgi:hypothetical protein
MQLFKPDFGLAQHRFVTTVIVAPARLSPACSRTRAGDKMVTLGSSAVSTRNLEPSAGQGRKEKGRVIDAP